jgi:tetrahydromethanopterin S-methyltransferase subunit G
MIEELVLQLRKEVADISNKTIAAERDLVAIQHRLQDIKDRVDKLEAESDLRIDSIRQQLTEIERRIQGSNINVTTRIDGNVDGDVAGGDIKK